MEYTAAPVAPPKKEAARETVLALLRQDPQPSRAEIAKAGGVAEATVTRWAKEAGTGLPRGPRPRDAETTRQRAIRLMLGQGWGPTEIGAALNISRQAAHKAIGKLRKPV